MGQEKWGRSDGVRGHRSVSNWVANRDGHNAESAPKKSHMGEDTMAVAGDDGECDSVEFRAWRTFEQGCGNKALGSSSRRHPCGDSSFWFVLRGQFV